MHDLPETRPGWRNDAFQAIARRAVLQGFYPSQQRYNLTIGREPKFVWFRVAKVGTRTIFDVLRKAGAVFELENGIFQHYRPAAVRNHFKFAFVRDPVERFLSCWRDRVLERNHFGFGSSDHARMKELGEFIAFAEGLDLDRCDVHLRRQARLVDLGNIDLLGRMESFESDLERMLSMLDLKVDFIPRQNSSLPEDGRSGLDDLSRGRIERLYDSDMRLFGYYRR